MMKKPRKKIVIKAHEIIFTLVSLCKEFARPG